MWELVTNTLLFVKAVTKYSNNMKNPEDHKQYVESEEEFISYPSFSQPQTSEENIPSPNATILDGSEHLFISDDLS